MTTEVDFYELLECERTADEATLKASYRKLAMKYHPDKNDGCKDSESRFKAISEAYDCLKDPQKRAAYDRYGHAAFRNGAGTPCRAAFTAAIIRSDPIAISRSTVFNGTNGVPSSPA